MVLAISVKRSSDFTYISFLQTPWKHLWLWSNEAGGGVNLAQFEGGTTGGKHQHASARLRLRQPGDPQEAGARLSHGARCYSRYLKLTHLLFVKEMSWWADEVLNVNITQHQFISQKWWRHRRHRTAGRPMEETRRGAKSPRVIN